MSGFLRRLFARSSGTGPHQGAFEPPFPDSRRNMLYPLVVAVIQKMVRDGKIPPYERLDPMPRGRDDLMVNLAFHFGNGDRLTVGVSAIVPADGWDIPTSLIEQRVLEAVFS